MPGGRLEPMRGEDLSQVLAIEVSSFPSPWKRDHFLAELRGPCWQFCWSVRRGAEVLAYACVWELDEELRINNIAVRADVRRRGVGDWLLRTLLLRAERRGCRTASLEVRPSNEGARRLYARIGFREVGRRKGYYQREGEDAILMALALPADPHEGVARRGRGRL